MFIDETSLTKTSKHDITNSAKEMSVGQLERALLSRYPASEAMPWDKTGLLVGNPGQKVAKIAIALDVTPSAIDLAAKSGANVLLTHHPAYLENPERIVPDSVCSTSAGSMAYQALTRGVSLMNFHTALDVSIEAQALLSGLLGLEFKHVLIASEEAPGKGYGQVCSTLGDGGAMSLAQLAARCTSVFGRAPRVWGDMAKSIRTVATFNGGTGSMLDSHILQGVDCLVCGEIKYHVALALSEEGTTIIELGHDVSELPYCMVLAAACKSLGIDESRIIVLDQSRNWQLPEATRI